MKKVLYGFLCAMLCISMLMSMAVAEQSQELNIAVFEGGFGAEYWKKIAAAFEEANPGVKVNMQISPTIGDTVSAQMVAGDVPDFLVLNGTSYSVIQNLIVEKGLLDITDVFEGPSYDGNTKLADKIVDGLLTSNVCSPYSDGKIYQAPLNGSPTGLIYNKALFEQNGWTVPTTWDEMFELGAKAKEQGISLFAYQGLYPVYLQWGLFPSVYSAIGDEGTEKYLNYGEGSVINTAAIDVLRNFEKMAREGYILPGTTALNHTQSQQEMMMNKALFIPCGTWIEGEMADAPRADGFQFAMAPCPSLTADQTRKVVVAMETMSIPAAAKNPELAKQFLRFLYTDKSVELFAEKANGVAATKNASELAKPFISEAMYNFYNIFSMDGVSTIVPGFAARAQGSKVDIDGEVYNPAADVVNGAMTADEWAQAIEDAFAQVRSELEAAK